MWVVNYYHGWFVGCIISWHTLIRSIPIMHCNTPRTRPLSLIVPRYTQVSVADMENLNCNEIIFLMKNTNFLNAVSNYNSLDSLTSIKIANTFLAKNELTKKKKKIKNVIGEAWYWYYEMIIIIFFHLLANTSEFHFEELSPESLKNAHFFHHWEHWPRLCVIPSPFSMVVKKDRYLFIFPKSTQWL